MKNPLPAGWSLANIAAIAREARGMPMRREIRTRSITRYSHA